MSATRLSAARGDEPSHFCHDADSRPGSTGSELMTDTISSDESPRWPVFERPPGAGQYGGRLRRISAATQTTAMTAAVSLVLLGGVATVTARNLAPAADPA